MMNIYMRKILKHDITHQISVTKEVLNGFFSVHQDRVSVQMKGKKTGYTGNVTFLLATDPRIGGDIKQIITSEGGIKVGDILIFIKNKDYYIVEVVTREDDRYQAFISMMDIERHLVINIDNACDSILEFDSSMIIGDNIIVYGIPGCGKSYYVEHTILGENNIDKKHDVFRTTFYLEYSNSDFVGQLLPVVDGKDIKYKPVPGPFTKALKRAYENKDRMIYLVIEEINRGNAAAIFGDLFQLLDRLKKNKDGRSVGDSEYPITNEFIEGYFKEEKVDFIPGNIYIPSNLTIIATMNTSDQNVFPLDTAFKRRWKMKRLTNNWSNHEFADYYIPFTNITWKSFVEAINEKMLESADDGLFLEDKQIGAYFISEDVLVKQKKCEEYKDNLDPETTYNEYKDKLENFTNKVIEYLYTDVFKFNKDKLFKVTTISFNKLCESIIKFEEEKTKYKYRGTIEECMDVKFMTIVNNKSNNTVVENDDETDDEIDNETVGE